MSMQDHHKAVVNAWRDFKDATGYTQTKAAKQLGINQSALSQYLRGPENNGIPLNYEFIVRFERLTGAKILDDSHGGVDAKVYALPIRFTLSGTEPQNKRIPVQTIVPTQNCFGVLVDLGRQLFEKGTVIIVDPEGEIRDSDMVVVRVDDAKEKVIVGHINVTDDGWVVASSHWGQTWITRIDEDHQVYRASGTYIPPKSHGAMFRQ
jgi:DNA-binding Lrp family transcriptional regulator